MTALGSLSPGVANTTAPGGLTAFDSFPDNALETIAAAVDTSYAYVATNSTGNYGAGYLLADTPSDFGNMNLANVRIRYTWSATPTNTTWTFLAARVVTTTGTVLAAADSGGAWQNVATSITTTANTSSANISFPYVNTGANKAAWNNAVLEIQVDRVRAKGGGTEEQRITAAEINGDYTEAAPVTTRVFVIS